MSSVGYKPSPLGYGSPRTSPFRRPVSPLPPSPSPCSAAPAPAPLPPSSPLANRQPQSQEQQLLQTTPNTTTTASPTKAQAPGARSSSSLFTPSRFVGNTGTSTTINSHSNNNNNTNPSTPMSLTPTAHTFSVGGGGESRTPRRLFVPPSPTAPSSTITTTTIQEPKAFMTSTTTTTSSQQQFPLGSPAHIISSPSRASTATGTTMYPQSLQFHHGGAKNRGNVAAHHKHNGDSNSLGHNNSDLSRLQPPQVRMLRDGFQILDRDGDGVVDRQDVADMLTQLGLPAEPSDTSVFFPPGGPQTLTLASFLNSVARPLARLSPASELLAAFSAFDDDDSGQVDVGELRDALLRAPLEEERETLSVADVEKVVGAFSGRRAFSKSGGGLGGFGARNRRGGGDVFRYREFVHSVVGGSGTGGGGANGNGGESEDGEDGEGEE
ncbi:EF-hand [Xylariaceae sp. FL0594]|nr:EF-hand [Xylariaceae sp. FL0594]